MHRFFSALMIFFCSSVFVFGQGMGKKTTVNGQILYELKGDKLSLKAQCENKTDKSLDLTYQLKIAQTDSGNNSVSNSQGGKKELAAHESKILSSSTLSWREGSSITVTLNIYHKKKLLDSNTLTLPVEEEEGKSGKK